MRWFNSILYVVESSVTQESALKRAISLASNNQASLTVIDVMPRIAADVGISYGGGMLREVMKTAIDERRSELESMIEPYRDQLDIRLEVLTGKRYLEVLRAVLRDNHDLLIKVAENPSYTQRLFGSDDMQFLRNCPCPVWLTRAEEKSKYETVLAAVDFDLRKPDCTDAGLSNTIAEISGSLAVSDIAALHFFHAWEAPAESLVRTWTSSVESAASYVDDMRSVHKKALHGLRDQLRARIGDEVYDQLDPKFHLRRGVATTAIPAIVNEVQADVLVMGTVARTGIAGWLFGNTAEAVLEQVQCSVIAVKPQGFVSPVEARAVPGS
ncbi:MAG TPA: universal stress protein [Woeseiaceae bacterium]|nr:universal stress protein [Woeseiaceae bacterium]